MKILVTGGAGFIGSHLAKKLLIENHEVVVVDDLSNGYTKNIPKGAEFIKLDLSDTKIYDKLPKDVDIVYHLASQASGEASCDNPIYDLKVNSLATLALLQWSKEHSIKKFIFTSSMGVYADNLACQVSENSPIEPKSFYGVNKLSSEEFIRIYTEEGLNATIFRLFNVYGPGQNMINLKQGMVSIYLSYVLNQKPVCVKGPLDRTRDFTYIDDVVNALYLGMFDSRSDNGVFNVCTGRELSVKDVLKKIFITMGVESDYQVDIYPRTPRDIDHSCGDNTLIKSVLSWEPIVKFEDGLEIMSKWAKIFNNK
jgi:UDP-glucose 4-epimerase